MSIDVITFRDMSRYVAISLYMSLYAGISCYKSVYVALFCYMSYINMQYCAAYFTHARVLETKMLALLNR